MDDVRTEDADKPVTRAEIRTIYAELESRILNLSQALAESSYGEATVRAAAEWADRRLGDYISHGHPYGALVDDYIHSAPRDGSSGM